MTPYLLQHLLVDACRQFPEKEALRHQNQSLSFEQLYTRSASLGYGLHSLNPQRGERIGILLDKSINQVVALLGTLFADNIFVLINPILHEDQIRHILQDCGIQLLIASEKYRSKFENIVNQTPLKIVLLENDLDEIVSSCPGKSPQNRSIGEDASNIIYTSGSTGLPKGIVITHRNLIDGARIVSQYLDLSERERILGLLPLNFDYGLNQLTSTLYCGCTLVLFQFFMPNSLLSILVDQKITGLPALPTIWASVFNPALCKIDPEQKFPDLRYITNTGGKLPVVVVKKIRQHFPNARLFLMYGLTEAFRSTFLDPDEVDRRPDSIGKAIPDVRVEVINEKGEICGPGQTGELIHAGACIAKGYWNNPKLTGKVYRPNPLVPKEMQSIDRVVYSGDLVKKDDEGFLYYVGRKDAMIKKEGYRISPTEVEELLMNHDDVAEAVACGYESGDGLVRILAVITVKRPTNTAELAQFCRQHAPEYLIPNKIMIKDQFLKTETGKIDRTRVIEEALAANVD